MARVVVVDRDPRSSHVLRHLLGPTHRVERWEDPVDEAAEGPHADVIIMNVAEGDADGLAKLAEVSASVGSTPIVALLDRIETRRIVDAIHRGASDVVTLPISTRELHLAISRALARREASLQSTPQLESPIPEIVGVSAPTVRLRELICQTAGCGAPVLVTGESGVGKEVVARALHRLSGRGKGPLEVRNCGAIPETLLESELFGTERGAYTDAIRRSGAFELASGGTLFLDEIGELSVAAQAKLLRALETSRFRRVGGTALRSSNARFISATNRDLRTAIRAREFRDDLYYRINVCRIVVPPLRDRVEDIPVLVRHFCEQLAEPRPEEAVPTFSSGALERLSEYAWPGNVRELRNVVWRALVVSNGLVVRPDDLDFV